MRRPAFTDIKGMRLLKQAYRHAKILQRSSPVRPPQTLNPLVPSYEAEGWFTITGAKKVSGFYPATVQFRNVVTESEGSRWYDYGDDFYVQGANYENLEVGKRYRGTVVDAHVATPLAFTGLVNTSSTSGYFTVGTGHGIEVADLVDVYWTGGSRIGMTVSAVTDTVITLTGGAGDNFPANDTVGSCVPLNTGTDRLPAAIVIYTVPLVQVYIDDDGGTVAEPTGTDDTYVGYLYESDEDGTWSVGDEVRVMLDPNGGDAFLNGKVYDCWLNGTKDDLPLYHNKGNRKIVVPGCDEEGNPIYTLFIFPENFGYVENVDENGDPL